VARIYFNAGEILNAETQGLRGEKALYRIMSWEPARFEFEPGQHARPVERAIEGSTSSVLMQGFAHIDELRDLVAALPDPSACLRVAAGRAEALDVQDLSTTERLILFAAGPRGARVGEIVDTVPQRDLDVYTAVKDLMQKGLLETA
jgi:hypothetical protein